MAPSVVLMCLIAILIILIIIIIIVIIIVFIKNQLCINRALFTMNIKYETN